VDLLPRPAIPRLLVTANLGEECEILHCAYRGLVQDIMCKPGSHAACQNLGADVLSFLVAPLGHVEISQSSETTSCLLYVPPIATLATRDCATDKDPASFTVLLSSQGDRDVFPKPQHLVVAGTKHSLKNVQCTLQGQFCTTFKAVVLAKLVQDKWSQGEDGLRFRAPYLR
jgi:hypothetical protein